MPYSGYHFMNSSLPESDQLLNEALGLKLLDAHKYWAGKRLLFNLLVGSTGLISIIGFGYLDKVFYIFGIVFWGLTANAFYSTGYVLESFVITNSGGRKSLHQYRTLLFWSGTLSYMLVTFAVAHSYYPYTLPILD